MPTHPPPEKRLKVLLAGYGHLGLAILEGLLENVDCCEIVGVYRWVSTARGMEYWDPVEAEFQRKVAACQLSDIICPGMNHYEFTAILGKLKPDVVLIGSWGEILKPHLLEQEGRPLFINCHPSKLPAHRGANPYSSAILAGETESGVTFHKVAPQIDAGPILKQVAIRIDEHETGETLRYKCVMEARQLVGEVIAHLSRHVCEGAPLDWIEQDPQRQSYFPPLRHQDGLIPWDEEASDIFRRCRALYPWVMSHSFLGGKREVWFFSPRFVPVQLVPSQPPGTIVSMKRGVLTVALSGDWVLEVPAWQFVGKRGPLPFWLSRLLGALWFRPGRQFRNPVGQTATTVALEACGM